MAANIQTYVLALYTLHSLPLPSTFLPSAGAGRTGTFVAIDTAIDRLAEEDDINIFECVELMRARRTQMVQNVVSYDFPNDL